ncbi:hypothetical protein KY363_02140 [Candidatus Woesearchaeota archaeon]|nr:hypothetical protein [Candidatus Woesearchaeota archaeon]
MEAEHREQQEGIRDPLKKKEEFSQTEILVPSTIFCDRSLSFLESLVEYLKDQLQLSYHEIGQLTNRDERNIWTLHHRVRIKREERPHQMKKAPVVHIPLSVVCDRSVSILEIVVEYLRDKACLKNSQVAEVLNRSVKTVSTAYIRTKKKRTADASQ